MLRALRRTAKRVMERCLVRSLYAALKQQGLQEMYNVCKSSEKQYTTYDLDSELLQTSTDALRAFQISLTYPLVNGYHSVRLVDIGGSSGSNFDALKKLYPYTNLICTAINMDPEAVKRIFEKGYRALCYRIEKMPPYEIFADVVMCFETLEHLTDPIMALRESIASTNCQHLVVTVPYVKRSRVGLHHIRHNRRQDVTSEQVHIFELSPEDWRLLFKQAGWRISYDKIYLQYPKWSLLYFLRRVWKWYDFEGFYGAVLQRDDEWSLLYKSWPK